MLRIIILIIIFITTSTLSASGQANLRFLNPNQNKFEVPFEISQNLIIVPATINGSQTMKFILDSGITKTIITEMTGIDTVSLNLARDIQIEGLGDGDPITAWYSQENQFIMESIFKRGEGIISPDMDVYIIPDNNFEFSKQFGLQINGLIGADFFLNFIVEIDYVRQTVTFHERESFNFKRKTKRYTQVPISINKGRPYIDAKVIQDDESEIEVNLLMDSGASLAMWLSVYSDDKIKLPEETFPSLLGQGLNGKINGINGRVKRIDIGPYKIQNPIVAYPDSAGISGMFNEEERNGTMGNEIIKRFHIIFDYAGQRCFIRSNKLFKNPFNYNRSGLEIEKPFYNIPVYQVYYVVPGSPADQAGVQPGDQIEAINYIQASNIELDQINSILYGNEGRTVRLSLIRGSETIRTKFRLDDQL